MRVFRNFSDDRFELKTDGRIAEPVFRDLPEFVVRGVCIHHFFAPNCLSNLYPYFSTESPLHQEFFFEADPAVIRCGPRPEDKAAAAIDIGATMHVAAVGPDRDNGPGTACIAYGNS